jgi:hypothetical protein
MRFRRIFSLIFAIFGSDYLSERYPTDLKEIQVKIVLAFVTAQVIAGMKPMARIIDRHQLTGNKVG